MKKNSSKSIVFLEGKKVKLVILTKDHIRHLVRWMNDGEVTHFLTAYLPMFEKDEEKWLEGLVERKKTDIILGIEVKGKLIGVMGIHGIDHRNGTATTGAFIGEKEYWGKGYGTDAKMILLNYAFNTLNLRKICSCVIAFNKRSLHYSLHCGYKIEGRQRKQIFKQGRYWDIIDLGLFKLEWIPYWKKYKARKER